ncbi:nitric oxide synthase oxygenase [Pseudonocardia humida]|uniref:nitric oxide synthase oxygenase n=1 Tax=Pseudonocardia humida TaxID=2800819 RepID=UPI0035563B4D
MVVRDSEVPAPRDCHSHSTDSGPAPGRPVDPAEAEEFLTQLHAETGRPVRRRLHEVLTEIDRTGTYTHTPEELVFGARVAWRNAARCIGRLYWNSLRVRDLRHVRDPADVAAECVTHLREAGRGGRIRSTLTVFAPSTPDASGPRIHNEQLIRYAGHRLADGGVRGDARNAALTDRAVGLGWRRPDPPGRFDVLPLLVSVDGGVPELFELPDDAVLEVELTHPELDWFADLALRWHAVPAISAMPLVVGGVTYPAAPFNGWYMATEIGARNLVDPDRYDLLPAVAAGMGLDTGSPRTLWRDRAALEVLRAVQHSFDAAGVTITDHHTESERFLVHVDKEERAGRSCPADWSWIVPPVSGGLTPVFHRYYDVPQPGTRPAYLTREGE